jgi:hypothetical protein
MAMINANTLTIKQLTTNIKNMRDSNTERKKPPMIKVISNPAIAIVIEQNFCKKNLKLLSVITMLPFKP